MSELDALRYRRLSDLVDTGEWSVAKHDITDKYGNTDDYYMDDKEEMDEYLDSLGDY